MSVYDTGLNPTWARNDEITDDPACTPSGKAVRRSVALTDLGPRWEYYGEQTLDPREPDSAYISGHQSGDVSVSVNLLIYRDDRRYGSLSAEDFVAAIRRQLREATAGLLSDDQTL